VRADIERRGEVMVDRPPLATRKRQHPSDRFASSSAPIAIGLTSLGCRCLDPQINLLITLEK
jgi:hypothetical protein